MAQVNRDAPVFDGRDTSSANLEHIRASYSEHGLVCVRLLTADKCDELVLEQWRRVILRQEWSPEYRITVHGADGRALDVDNPADQPDFLSAVIGPLPAQRRKKFEAGWPLHRGFGACCDPAIFHLEGVWGVRQDPDLYQIASHISGEKRLWVDINRSIQKLPGQGDNEFLHFDFNPFSAVHLPDTDASAPRGLCGKVCYTQARFVYVPGTHTREFLEDFVSKYAEHYPNVKQSDKKFGLNKDKPDPLNLVAGKRCLVIPRGCLVFWHPRLLHGQMKTPMSDPVEYGSYIGVFPAGARPRYQEVSGVDELQDRVRSYKEGRAPLLWPSFDAIHFYPKKFDNFPHLMDAYIKKLPPGHPMIASRVSANGISVKYLQPLAQPDYQPAPLTTLGKRLLGLEPWRTPAEACAGAARVGAVGAVGGGNEPGDGEARAQGLGGIAGGRERKQDVPAREVKTTDDDSSDVQLDDARKDVERRGELGRMVGGEHSVDAGTGAVGNAEMAALQVSRSGTVALGGHGGVSAGMGVGVAGTGGASRGEGQDAGVGGNRSQLDDACASASAECVFNHKADLRSIAKGSASPRFLLTWRKSQGLENDANVYQAELERRKFQVRKLEVPKCCRCEQGVGPHKCSSDLSKAALDKVEELVLWCDVLIGFESIGSQDKRVWECVKKARESRSSLLVVLVPNLEWCKLSNGWTKHTVRELLRGPDEETSAQSPARAGIDVVIAKTECTFHRLEQLNCGNRFTRGNGNLLLIPHTTVVEQERDGHAASLGAPPRRDVIVFAGYSKAKNVTECVKAAVILVSKPDNKLGKVIIKCSHRCNPPSAEGQQAAAAAGACCEPAAKRPRVDEAEALPAHEPCECQKARDKHNKDGLQVVELVEQRITEAEKADLYRRCRLAICASKREGFGHTILEAAAYGCQVVTTDGMPMKSILRQEVGLAMPSEEASWNLGLNYQVKAAAIVAAAEGLLQADHSVAACRGQLQDRIADFRCHFDHFIHSILPPGNGLHQPVQCSNPAHRAASESMRVCPAGCDRCGTGRLRASLKPVNRNTPDKLVWLCSNPACGRNKDDTDTHE